MRRIAVALALLATPLAPLAHELAHQVERGRAVAVRVTRPDGRPLADVSWEVYSPASPATPYQRGRTDRAGWLAFVPDGGGSWRVRVVEPDGHGLVLDVEAAPPPARAAASEPFAPGPAPVTPAANHGGTDPGGTAWALRPLLGVAAVGVVFGALVVLRRRGTRP